MSRSPAIRTSARRPFRDAKRGGIPDWNVVATVREQGFEKGTHFLRALGRVAPSAYFNVLVMRVADAAGLLAELSRRIAADPGILAFLSHVTPAHAVFSFQSAADFEDQARTVVLGWVPRLAGKSFHVRLRRRGFKGRLSTPDEERFLDDAVLEALEAGGTPGHVSFEDPDAVIIIDTIDNRAGVSFWTRTDREVYPFLGLDD